MNTLLSKLSLRAQFLLVFTLAFALAFAGFAAVFYYQYSAHSEGLAKENLQSSANEVSHAIALEISISDVLEVAEAGEDSPARARLIDLFNQAQDWYDDLGVEITLLAVDFEAEEVVTLIYLEEGEDESSPIEVAAIEDEEDWGDLAEATIEYISYGISEEGDTLWTSSSTPLYSEGEPINVVIGIDIRTDNELSHVREQLRNTLLLSLAIGLPLLVLVTFLVTMTITHELKQLIRAAAAIEQDKPYQSFWLQSVVARGDELGQLGRVFDKMATEVRARVERLKNEVVQLKIEIDQSRKQQQVSEITDSDYFKDLQEKAANARRRTPPIKAADDTPAPSSE